MNVSDTDDATRGAQAGALRTLVASWEDPAHALSRAWGKTGIELMRDFVTGELPAPPLARVLGIEVVTIDEGHAVFRLVPGEQHYNPMSTVHGGVISSLLDTAMGCAVHSTLPSGGLYTTTDLQVRFIRPVTVATGEITCVADVVHRGSRLATAEGRLRDWRGRLIAHATTSCLLMNPTEEGD